MTNPFGVQEKQISIMARMVAMVTNLNWESGYVRIQIFPTPYDVRTVGTCTTHDSRSTTVICDDRARKHTAPHVVASSSSPTSTATINTTFDPPRCAMSSSTRVCDTG